MAKKIFFLYPHNVVQEQLITALIQSEYEVSQVNDYKKASQLLYRFPSSILFINIEAGMDEPMWEQYIKGLLREAGKHDARIGVLTNNPTPELSQKYLNDIGIQCGFVSLKQGLTESAKNILKTLEANTAKGDRKFVRVKCPANKSSLNINYLGKVLQGLVIDISSAGMACEVTEEIKLQTSLDDIQVVIWGTIIKLSGIVMGQRQLEGKRNIYVIMFDNGISKDSRTKVYATIRKILQAEIDAI